MRGPAFALALGLFYWQSAVDRPRVLELRVSWARPANERIDSVDFESPVDLPWDTIARAALPKVDFQNPGDALLKQFWFEPGADSIVPFEAPLRKTVPRGPFLGLGINGVTRVLAESLAGAVSFEAPPIVSKLKSTAWGQLRGSAAPESGLPVLFVLWATELPRLDMRMASAVASGTTVRVTGRVANQERVWNIGAADDWQAEDPRLVDARLFVDGASDLVYLLVSAREGRAPCPEWALLFEVGGELRRVGRHGVCDA